MEHWFIHVVTWVPRISKDQCVFHSELAGIYSVIRLVNRVCHYYSIMQGAITLGYDNLGLLQCCFNHTNPTLKIRILI